MQAKRKLLLAAALVAANGLLTLTFLAPQAALASTCARKAFCGVGCYDLAQCQAIADPGCTATNATCALGVCPPHGAVIAALCDYM